MSAETSGIQAGQENGIVIVRVVGKGTHQNSHFLKKYLHQCLQSNHKNFELELDQCTYMDSTFLGTLAGFGSKLKEKSLPLMKIVNATDRVRGMIEGLGISILFELIQRNAPTQDLKDLQGGKISVDVKSSEMLEAHETLVKVSHENEAKFRDVISLLKDEVAKKNPK
jgi:anti-sigma B factor antagonist